MSETIIADQFDGSQMPSRIFLVVEGLLSRVLRAAPVAAAAVAVLVVSFGGSSVRAQDAPAATDAAAATVAITPIANAESSAPAPGAVLQGRQLLAALRRGGYVVYFRHAATDYSRGDAGMKDYADCDRQRLLSEQGKADAARIGRSIRALGLPVGEALASPYCRTMEHARLMLGEIKPRTEIREAQAGDYAGLKRLLADPVERGGNRWIVGHGTPFRSVAGAPHLAEGEAAVIEPGTTRWTVVARLAVDDWQSLAAAR